MEIIEILRRFERTTGRFEREAVDAAVERRKEIIPGLLRVLEDTVERAEELAGDGGYMAHIYAMCLLAQFRETRAYPLVVRIALLPRDVVDALLEEFITENLPRVLASVCGGELGGIMSIIEDEAANEWARGSAIGSLVTLVAAGLKERDEIVSYFASLFRGKLAREESDVWAGLVSNCCDLYPAELVNDIQQAYEDGLVYPGYINMDDVRCELAQGKDRTLAKLAGHPDFHLVEDTVEEIGWWHCFQEDRGSAAEGKEVEAGEVKVVAPAPVWMREEVRATQAVVTVKRPAKVGKNEPCPCGSGKKYKKCCGG